LIRVKAFGLNRSELFTRQGRSPSVHFPRILGIEAAGVVEDAPGGEFEMGDVVATAMGGMGGQFDGGYAGRSSTIGPTFPSLITFTIELPRNNRCARLAFLRRTGLFRQSRRSGLGGDHPPRTLDWDLIFKFL
jgi:NADPH:quinone reductase-like Zn-dependent oxidoreductase